MPYAGKKKQCRMVDGRACGEYNALELGVVKICEKILKLIEGEHLGVAQIVLDYQKVSLIMKAGVCNVAHFGGELCFGLTMAGDVQNLRSVTETFPKRVDGGDLMIIVDLFPRDAKLLMKLLKFHAMVDR